MLALQPKVSKLSLWKPTQAFCDLHNTGVILARPLDRSPVAGKDERMGAEEDREDAETSRALALAMAIVGVGFITVMLLAAWLIF